MTSNNQIKMNNEQIEKVNSIKYLGFILDRELKLKEHIDYICKKIGKKIGFFKRLRSKISIITAINIYNTIIKPHFEFGSTIIYTCCTDQQISRLQKLQNRAMRCILRCNRYAPINYMLNCLKWLNIRQRLKLNTLVFIQKMKMGDAPQYLCEQLIYVGDVQPYNLRNSEHFRLQQISNNTMQRSLFYKGLNEYNKLQPHIRNERNINVFRKEIIKCINNF